MPNEIALAIGKLVIGLAYVALGSACIAGCVGLYQVMVEEYAARQANRAAFEADAMERAAKRNVGRKVNLELVKLNKVKQSHRWIA